MKGIKSGSLGISIKTFKEAVAWTFYVFLTVFPTLGKIMRFKENCC
jgi:hypothetical protein